MSLNRNMSRTEAALAKKGKLLIIEFPTGNAKVAIQAGGSTLTLRGGQKDKLLAELLEICRGWPDLPCPQGNK
jgi:hypothetical protein